MPGKVTRVQVSKGDEVKQGQGILSLEAMKMEAAVYAPRDASVAEVLVETDGPRLIRRRQSVAEMIGGAIELLR